MSNQVVARVVEYFLTWNDTQVLNNNFFKVAGID